MRRRRPNLAIAALVGSIVIGCGPSPAADPQTSLPAASAGAAGSTTANTGQASASPADAAGRRSDLAYLVERLEAIHPNPYLDEGPDAFLERVSAIERRADTMTDAEFLAAVMDLMGHRERDGHSGAWALAQKGERLHAWPVWLWDFPDGLRVVAAAEDPDLIGARLVLVGGLRVDEAWDVVEPLVPRDNASTLRANLPMHLTMPEVIEALGIRGPGDPGLTFELADGSTRELTAEPLPIEAFRDWIYGLYGTIYPTGLPPDEAGPPHLRRRSDAFWSETLADPAGLYVAYNNVLRADPRGRSVVEFANEIRAAAPDQPDQPFAIDLRNNPGGDNTTFRPLRDAVETMARERPGHVSVIAGRSTFSAAGNFVTELLVGPEADGIRLVGEPPGGGLNIYGDVRVVTLPASGIVVLISSRYHERAPGDERLALEPDAAVELSWDDYVAGRDPLLEAALGD